MPMLSKKKKKKKKEKKRYVIQYPYSYPFTGIGIFGIDLLPVDALGYIWL